jgi:hypothetical protein
MRVNFGVPTDATFRSRAFRAICDRLITEAKESVAVKGSDCVLTPDDFGGDWRQCCTFPYVIHRDWWDRCGPWEHNHGKGATHDPPDIRFFKRCREAGAEFVVCRDSICYHHEAVERRGTRRPVGIEAMPPGR